jgi:poly(A) polymerase
LLPTRRPDGPVLPGDVVADGVVRGFAYVPTSSPDEANDRLLVEGDEVLAEPPARAVPDSAAAVRQSGLLPPEKLPTERIHRAAEIDSTLPGRVSRMLARPDGAWSRVAVPLIEQLEHRGHLVWMTGGAVRDLVGGEDGKVVNDLDLTGTAPPGRFTATARTVLRRNGFAEFREKVSPDSLVCSTAPSGGGRRLFEYRPLMLTGFRFPASGGDLGEDAYNRDFTINSLYYDARRDIVIDPTGRALTDVTAVPRQLVSVNETGDPVQLAHIVIRGIKFVLRWNDTVVVEPLRISDEPPRPGWLQRIHADDWPKLVAAYRRSTNGFTSDTHDAAARSLGAVAVELLDELRRWGS